MSLETGIKAVEEGNYLEAVGILEAFCQKGPQALSRDYTQAKMWLALAYHGLGETDQVVPLCKELSKNSNPEISDWASQWLKSIAAYKYTPQYLSELKESGYQALKQKNYPQAIKLIEDFCKNTPDQKSLDYQQAKMWLVQAYRGNRQMEGALSLCQELEKSEDTMIRQWAKQTNPMLQDNLKNTVNNPKTPVTTEDTIIERAPLAKKQTSVMDETPGENPPQLDGVMDETPGENPPQLDGVMDETPGENPPQLDGVMDETPGENPPQLDGVMDETPGENPPQLDGVMDETPGENPPQLDGVMDETVVDSQEEKALQVPIPKREPTTLRLGIRGIASNLALASGVTLCLLIGMVLVLSVSLVFIIHSPNPHLGLIISVGITIAFNLGVFFLSPMIMDVIQGMLYGTDWQDIEEIRQKSPEAAAIIEQVCAENNLKIPLLGLIYDDTPTAFTYGSFPNTARLVVSQGLFKYLDQEEIATVYAHELGHIVHWDFAVMTLGSTLVQITYLIYTYARRFENSLNNDNLKKGIQSVSVGAYIFYVIGNYLLLYLSRTREYYADHFAAEVTSNPNALSRSLVKIAYGIVEEGQKSSTAKTLTEGTRALGIYDAKGASSSGTAYRVSGNTQGVGRVFLWDLFNPWGWWMELNSTHPLTGKRIRALSNYAEQMDLNAEFDMAAVIKEGSSLDKGKLYKSFIFDLLLFNAPFIGFIAGIVAAFALRNLGGTLKEFISLPLIGFGFGTLIKTAFMYPDYKRARETDILTLMSDPYASPLRGRPVRLKGELIGRGDAGNKLGSDLQLQDSTGMIFTRYTSMFGSLGNFFFGLTQVQSLIGTQVAVLGWFRRGVSPWLDLIQLDNHEEIINSYHRLWSIILGVGAIFLGLVLSIFLPRSF